MLLVYITFPSEKKAERVGKILVEEKLARCVNIIPRMRSIYSWKGKPEVGNECILLAKASERNYKKLERRVRQLHPYELPCIIAIRVDKGSPEFIRWIEGNE